LQFVSSPFSLFPKSEFEPEPTSSPSLPQSAPPAGPHAPETASPHSIGGREFPIEAMGLRKLPACLCTLAGLFEIRAQVVVSLGEVGFEPDGLTVLRDSSVVLAFVVKGET
jgi:hypothetical protein